MEECCWEIGSCDSYVDELLGVFEGLKLVRARGFNRVELHVDSWVVVTTLFSSKIGTLTSWSLLQHSRRLLDMNWEVRICHSYRKANVCADSLANIACDGDYGLKLLKFSMCCLQVSKKKMQPRLHFCTLFPTRRAS